MKKPFSLVLAALLCHSAPSLATDAQADYDTILLGSHMLSLQWVSWDKFGTAKVSKEGEIYRVSGRQDDAKTGNFLSVEGTLEPVSPRHLAFDGKIVMRDASANDGRPCTREGKFNFKATGTRKYWRLQEMDNPCTGYTDYVDLYFKK